MLYFAKLH